MNLTDINPEKQRDQGALPPASSRQAPSIHLAHVAHANDADGKALHVLGDLI